ncbi:MAG: PorP/SprF family type IX secretion system membrane protein [Bacteroidia bacterium]|nr:PorP/SprF family type IX secretion system membrane protein [Bacteroidia bacterium]MCF8428204.1 PorP/SprF family type IX secretion system membrane protein [Bacteroidia bacterium]
MKKLLISLAGITLLFAQPSLAQVRSHYYTNLLNPFLVNPALAGNTQGINALFNARTMLGGIDGSPRTINFGINGSLEKDAGLGLKVVSDWSGIFQTTNIEMAYSKKVQLVQNQFLSFGLSLGAIQTTLQSELVNGNVNLADPKLNDPSLYKLKIASGAGFIYNYANKFEFATSFPSLVNGDDKINGFFVSSAQYNHAIGKDNKYVLQPRVNYFNMQYSDKLYDVLLKGTWNQTVSLSTGYRNSGAILMGAGFNFNSFSASYLYYYHTDKLNGVAPAQNEIAISFHFNKIKKAASQPRISSDIDEFSSELSKINRRVNGLIQVEQSNPGLVNIKQEVMNINKDLEVLMKKFKVENPEHLRIIKNIQESIDLIIAKYGY